MGNYERTRNSRMTGGDISEVIDAAKVSRVGYASMTIRKPLVMTEHTKVFMDVNIEAGHYEEWQQSCTSKEAEGSLAPLLIKALDERDLFLTHSQFSGNTVYGDLYQRK